MTIINTNSISGINSITAQGASGIEFYESSGVNQRLRITSGGLLDVSGGIQISENVTPTSGAGLELFREGGGGGQVQAFDRGGSAWLPLILKGSTQIFHTSGSERLRITSDGRVNIGQASDVDHTLCVAGTDNATSLTGGHNQGIQLQNKSTTDGTYSQIEWRNSSGGRYARIAGIQDDANGNGGQLAFLTENTSGSTVEALRITSTGRLILPTGTSGIQFGTPDDPAASGGINISSQTLDDYEEGTWTPGLTNFTLGNGILTGQYTKIGNIVHVTFRLDAGSTTTFTGAANGISGLPFTNALASNTGYLTASNPSNNWFGFTQQYSTGTGTNFLQWITSSSNHQVGSATQPFTWGSSTAMRFNMTYRAA